MLRLKIIGCSSGTPHPHLAGSSYLLIQDDRRILFDAGEGLSSALLRTRVDPLAVDTIFISHLHSDHVGGLFLFLQMLHGLQRTDPLDLFVPSEAESAIKTWLNATYLFLERLSVPLEIHPIDEDLEFEMTNLRITPVANSHLASKREFVREYNFSNRLQCYSFVIEASGKKIVYSADLGSLKDIAANVAGADLLLIEAMHVDLDELPQLVLRQGVGKVVLTHLPEDFDAESITSKFSSVGHVDLRIASEGMEIELL